MWPESGGIGVSPVLRMDEFPIKLLSFPIISGGNVLSCPVILSCIYEIIIEIKILT
jgi:hypothetical protein